MPCIKKLSRLPIHSSALYRLINIKTVHEITVAQLIAIIL